MSLNQMQSILSTLPLPMMIARRTDNQILFVNKQFAQLLGSNPEELTGQVNPGGFIDPADRQDLFRILAEQGFVNEEEVRLMSRSGHAIWVLFSVHPISYEEEEALLLSMTEITRQKQTEIMLAQRAKEMETVSKVSAFATSILQIDELLQSIVDLTKEQFGLYHTHIYLLDKQGAELRLASGAGDIGRQMVAEERIIPLAQEQSLVAQAARTRRGVIENDVSSNPTFLQHPLLPDTKAEMAVPMLVGEQLIGVLDVQADQTDYFTQESIEVQTTLAAQIGVAIQNAHSFEQNLKLFTEAEALLEITHMASHFLELDNILGPVLDKVLAATGFKIGLISIFNPQAEQLQLAAHRLPEPMAQNITEGGLKGSLCELVYNRGEAIVLTDLTHDAPVDVTGLVESGYRSYQGVPLESSGDVLGTLCLFHTARLAEEETNLAFLAAIGQQIGNALRNSHLFQQAQIATQEAQQSEEILRRSESQLSQALEIAKLGYWEFDVANDLFTFNDQFYSLFHTTAEAHGGYQLSSGYYAQNFVYPDDMPLVGSEIEKALTSTERHYTRLLEHRVLYADGGVGYISVNVNVERDDAGNLLRFYGANQDITERKLAEDELRRSGAELSQALEIAKLGYWEFDVANDLFTFNDQFYALFHTTAEAHGGYQLSSGSYSQNFVYPDDLAIVGEEIGKALNSTEQHYNRLVEHRILYADGGVGYISVNVNVERDAEGNLLRFYGANQDITGRKLAEEAIAKQARELQIVAELATAVATTLEQQKLLQEVVDLTKERFGLYHAHIYLINPQNDALVLASGADEVGRQLVQQKHVIRLDSKQSLVAQAALTGTAVVVNNVRENLNWLPNKLLPDTHAEMAIPMAVGGRVIGVLDVQAKEVDRFTEQDVQITTTLAAQVSIALENARSFEQAQTAVAEMNALAQRLTGEGWDNYLDHRTGESLRFLFDGESVQEARDTAVMSTLHENPNIFMEKPIEVRGVKIGKMALVPEEVDPELEEIVSSVMRQLGDHIENLRLIEQTQSALGETEALYVGSEKIILSNTEEDILLALVQSTVLKSMDRANILLFEEPVEDEVPTTARVAAVWSALGEPPSLPVGAKFKASDVPLMALMSATTPLVIDNVLEDPRFDERMRQFLKQYAMTSILQFPLTVGKQWIGWVSAHSHEAVYMDDVQIRRINSLVKQAAVVLQTTILFRQEQSRARREQLLREITTKVRSSVDVDTVMRTAVAEIGRTLGRRAFIELGNDEPENAQELNGAS